MAEQYLPLYRKYRPQTFQDIVGQENLVKAFTNAINTGKIAHAYLFCGPRGTGKTSSARILAKSLNCQNGPTLTPCGKCPSCLDLINGNMLDIIEMDAASNRHVEDAQNIIDKIHYAPVNGKYKIFIIDEIHMISNTAFNALLKTLEEPPKNVIFILATTEPQKVIETIISRCQRFDFKRITTEDIKNRLSEIAKKEKININDAALYTIAKNAQGGMRDALALLDQISVLDVNNEISPDKVNEILGKIDNETLAKITENIFNKSVENTIQIINTIYSKGNDPLIIIENLLTFMRNLSVTLNCKNDKIISELTFLSPDFIALIKEKFQTISINQISKIIEKLTYYYKEIKYTNNRYLWLELCFIDIASDSPAQNNNSQPPVQKVTTPINQVASTPEDKKNDIKEVIPETKVLKSESNNDWKEILDCFDSPTSRTYFNTFAKPVELSKEKVTIAFKNETFAQRAKEDNKKMNDIKKACQKYYNSTTIDIIIKVGNTQISQKENDSEKKNDIKNPKKPDNKSTDTPQNKENDNNTPATEKAEEYSNIDENEITSLSYEAKYNDQVKLFKDLFEAKIFD